MPVVYSDTCPLSNKKHMPIPYDPYRCGRCGAAKTGATWLLLNLSTSKEGDTQ